MGKKSKRGQRGLWIFFARINSKKKLKADPPYTMITPLTSELVRSPRMSAMIENMTEMRAEIATLQKSVATLQTALAALESGQSALPSSAKKGKKSKKASAKGEAEVAEGAAEPSAKKEPTAWNILVAETVTQMKAEGWPAWTDLKGVAWPASRRGTVKDKSGAERETFVFDGNAEGEGAVATDGKEVSPALGGMVRASFLKAQSDPEAAAKARKYHAKLAEKRSTGSAEKEAPVADGEEAPAAKKGSGRPKMTEEQKAAAKVKRDAKKAAEAKPEAKAEAEAEAEFEEPAAAEPPKPVQKKKIVIAGAPQKKVVDLSFYAWEHKGVDYFTNDRGDVVSTEFEWVGLFDGTTIDTSAPEAADLGSAKMRE